MPYAYAYALVKTRLYSHLRLSFYHSIIDSIDTRFIQYLSFYFSTSFPKIMFWLFTEVYKKIMSNDLRSKEMISPLRIHAVGLFQACSLFLTRKKKRKSCAFLLPSFWFTVFLFCHYCGVKRYFYDTGLKSKALWVLVAKHSCTFHTFSLTLRLDMHGGVGLWFKMVRSKFLSRQPESVESDGFSEFCVWRAFQREY